MTNELLLFGTFMVHVCVDVYRCVSECMCKCTICPGGSQPQGYTFVPSYRACDGRLQCTPQVSRSDQKLEMLIHPCALATIGHARHFVRTRLYASMSL